MARSRALRLRRAILFVALGALLLVFGASAAIKQVPWFGPWLANSLRAVFGTEAVTWLEEGSAKVEDAAKRLARARQLPRSLEQARVPAPQSSSQRIQPEPAAPPGRAAFRPLDVRPMVPRVAAAGDGRWRAIADPFRPQADPILFATLLHPDAKRPWAEVFVVAVALESVRLHAVAGTLEPEATTAEGKRYVRRGLIPPEQQPWLLAAFNGGFMTRHGQHGMRVDGVTLVPARPHLCTVLGLTDGELMIGTWRGLQDEAERAEREGREAFWRQAAPCMYEAGALNLQLRDEKSRNWGATIDGDVVIRRSALGLDGARRVLFVGVSNDTTARAMADAMHHAGASDVAQLDVNWSYPRFVVFPETAAGRRAQGLFEGFVFQPDDYVRRPATRDFFYLLRRELPR